MRKYRTRSWRAFEPPSAAPAPRPAARLRILGLDPGSRCTGFGVIDCAGTAAAHVAHGSIVTGPASATARLRVIFEAVQALVAEHRPDEVAVERVVDSALKLGQARGAALCAVPQGTPVFEYAARAIKLTVVGFGGADKRQVAHMMRALLHLEGKVGVDASDALAVALCHAHSRRTHFIAHAASGGATVIPVGGSTP